MRKNIIPYNKDLLPLARKLRKNLTWGEARLWKYLKGNQFLGLKFKKQVPINEYIVDFYCKEKRLIIEIDGGSHDEYRYKKDIKREQNLENLELRVIRFTEREVLNSIDTVLQTIETYINSL